MEDFFSKCAQTAGNCGNPQETADLVKFTEEILN